MDEMSTLDRIDTCAGFLDKLVDAQGRAKAGYIYILNEFLTKIREDVLVMEEKLKDKEAAKDG